MTVLEQTGVVCPPNGDAECERCGLSLRYHVNLIDPDGLITADQAWCVDASLRASRFRLAAGESLACPDASTCAPCGTAVCSEHSNELASCAGGIGIHHLACIYECADCREQARIDAATDRAIAAFKGE